MEDKNKLVKALQLFSLRNFAIDKDIGGIETEKHFKQVFLILFSI